MIPSGFGDTEFTEEQPQLKHCTEEKETPDSGDRSFSPLIKGDPQDWNALGIQISFQHSAADKSAKVLSMVCKQEISSMDFPKSFNSEQSVQQSEMREKKLWQEQKLWLQIENRSPTFPQKG